MGNIPGLHLSSVVTENTFLLKAKDGRQYRLRCWGIDVENYNLIEAYNRQKRKWQPVADLSVRVPEIIHVLQRDIARREFASLRRGASCAEKAAEGLDTVANCG
jgi:hypothetical protein